MNDCNEILLHTARGNIFTLNILFAVDKDNYLKDLQLADAKTKNRNNAIWFR